MEQVAEKLLLIDPSSGDGKPVRSFSDLDAQGRWITRDKLGVSAVELEYRGAAVACAVSVSFAHPASPNSTSQCAVLELMRGAALRVQIACPPEARLIFEIRPLPAASAAIHPENTNPQDVLKAILRLFEFEGAEREHLRQEFLASASVDRGQTLPIVQRSVFVELLRKLGMPADDAEKASRSLIHSARHDVLDEVNFTIGLLLMDPASSDIMRRYRGRSCTRGSADALKIWHSLRARLLFRMFDHDHSDVLDRAKLKPMFALALQKAGVPWSAAFEHNLDRMLSPTPDGLDAVSFQTLLDRDLRICGIDLTPCMLNICTLPRSGACPMWVYNVQKGDTLVRKGEKCNILEVVGRPPEFVIETASGSTATCPWYRLEPPKSEPSRPQSSQTSWPTVASSSTGASATTASEGTSAQPSRQSSRARPGPYGKKAPSNKGAEGEDAPLSVPMPQHWSTPPQCIPSQGCSLVDLTDDADLFQKLERCLSATADPSWLGCDRDSSERGMYSALKLAAAWRIEHPTCCQRYRAAVAEVAEDGRRIRATKCAVKFRPAWQDATSALPPALDVANNEALLVHGTLSTWILTILADGFNERLSYRGLPGRGSYLAEDPGKADQYTDEDREYAGPEAPLHELHKRLYRQGRPHPSSVRYMLICRVVLGHAIRSRDGFTSLDHRGDFGVYGNDEERELAEIPGVSPRARFHAWVVESGGTVERCQEVVQFHADRIFPEYLLAYRRVYND